MHSISEPAGRRQATYCHRKVREQTSLGIYQGEVLLPALCNPQGCCPLPAKLSYLAGPEFHCTLCPNLDQLSLGTQGALPTGNFHSSDEQCQGLTLWPHPDSGRWGQPPGQVKGQCCPARAQPTLPVCILPLQGQRRCTPWEGPVGAKEIANQPRKK